MRLHIRATDHQGQVYEGHIDLVEQRQTKGRPSQLPKAPKIKSSSAKALDFSLPERAFIKTYSEGLSGPKKFVLVLAYLAKGKTSSEILFSDVHSHWDRMTSLLGGKFNRFYSGTAKDFGWVDTKKPGVYVLRSNWRDAIE